MSLRATMPQAVRFGLVLGALLTFSLVSSAQAENTTVMVSSSPTNGSILVDSAGMTLYTWAGDTPGMSNCYDACERAWPPVVATGAPTGPAGLQGTLGTAARNDGSTQVTFNDWPLYRFARDTAPGDMNGEGVNGFGGLWSVVAATAQSASNGAPATTAGASTTAPAAAVAGVSATAPAAAVQPQTAATPATSSGPMPPTTASSTTASSSVVAVPASATPVAAATVTVTIKDFEFSPVDINVNVGDTVVWTNNGPATHTATARDGLWDTGPLSTGQASYYTFSTPGRYRYMCMIHPRMRGTVTVSQSGTGASTMTQVGSQGGMAIYSSPFDSGYSMGYGVAGNSRMGYYGMSQIQSYYYDPVNGYYYAAAYPGYPYDKGYGLNSLIYGSYPYSYYPYSSYGGYPYSSYPYSYYGGYPYGYGYGYGSSSYYGLGGYPYSYYGLGYSSYAGYGQGYPYSYLYGPYQPYGLLYGNSYNPAGPYSLYGLYGGYSNLYSPLYSPYIYSYYNYPYSYYGQGYGYGSMYPYGVGGYPYYYPSYYPLIY